MVTNSWVKDMYESIEQALLGVGETIEDSVQKYVARIHREKLPIDAMEFVQQPSPQQISESDITLQQIPRTKKLTILPPPIPGKAKQRKIPIPIPHVSRKTVLPPKMSYRARNPMLPPLMPREVKHDSLPPPIPSDLAKTTQFYLPLDLEGTKSISIPPPIPEDVRKKSLEECIQRQSKATVHPPTPFGVGRLLKSASTTYTIERKIPGRNPVYLARNLESQVEFVVKGYADEVDPHGFERDSITFDVFSGREPNLLSVCESIEDSSGNYNVFPFIKGMNFDQYISKHGPLGERDLLLIFPELLDALATVHMKGIVHRDVKEANIMIDKTRKPYLFDFDMCYHQSLVHLEDADLAPGTITHMAPEVWQGQSRDPRTDLYAMGVVLYRALTDQLPFSCKNWNLPKQERVIITARQHLYSLIPNPQEFSSDLSDNIVSVIQKALAKDPNNRYQSATDMKKDIILAVN